MAARFNYLQPIIQGLRQHQGTVGPSEFFHESRFPLSFYSHRQGLLTEVLSCSQVNVFCVFVCVHVHMLTWRSKDSYVELVFFFHLYVGSDGQTQVARLGE